MTEEMQKTKGCLQRDRTESEEYAGVQTVIGISHESLVEVNLSSEMLLETIMSRGNMNAAYKRVMSNKGSGGNDESKMFRFLFQEFLPQEPAFESADVLCISDFMWPFLDNDVKQSIQNAKVDGMKFYGLVVSHRGYCEYVEYQGELDSLQICDSKWVWTGKECVEV